MKVAVPEDGGGGRPQAPDTPWPPPGAPWDPLKTALRAASLEPWERGTEGRRRQGRAIRGAGHHLAVGTCAQKQILGVLGEPRRALAL